MNSKLNPNAQAWVAALRSGEYKQGTDFLCVDGKFCCLGVACDLFEKAEHTITKEYSGSGVVRYNGSDCSLPNEVRDWLGLRSREGFIHERSEHLSNINDNGKTFAEIADIIESAPEGLFVEVAE